MNFKILSFAILSMLLLSMASAMTVYADFSDATNSKTINEGDSISFNVDFFSMNPPMTIKAELYQGTKLIRTFLKTNTNERSYYNTYTYTPFVGTFEIRVIGTDKVNTDNEYLRLVVNSVSPTPDTTPPIITILGSNPATIIQGNTYTDVGAIATDNIDGDITSNIQTTSNVNINIIGTYIVTYIVSDNAGNQATATRTVYVVSQNPTNHAPVITSSPVTSVTEGNNYVYQVDAEDYEDDDLTYSLIQDSPGWLYINSNTGEITGTAPLVDSSTNYDVTVEVSDGINLPVTQTYTLRVKNYVSGSSSGGSRIISDNDFYYQNKYYDQFNKDVVLYTAPKTQNIFGLTALTFFYFLIAIISLGIILVVFLLARNLRK